MKDYFKDILKQSVPSVPARSDGKEGKDAASFQGIDTGTLEEKAARSTRSQSNEQNNNLEALLPRTHRTLSEFIRVPSDNRKTVASRVERVGTLEIENIQYCYNERAAILEYDNRLPRREAELLAFKDGFIEYVNETYPAIEHEYRAITQAVGGKDDTTK